MNVLVVDIGGSKVKVLATGQEGMGDWMIPEPLAHLPAGSVATVAHDIDFEGLRGKREGKRTRDEENRPDGRSADQTNDFHATSLSGSELRYRRTLANSMIPVPL